MRLMSFSLTTDQVRARTKTVTRRMGWTFLKPGDRVQAVEKAMGLKKGEQVKRLAVLRVVDVRRERLDRIWREPAYGRAEVKAEGFEGRPEGTPANFVEFFAASHGCRPDAVVTRIEFAYEDQSS